MEQKDCNNIQLNIGLFRLVMASVIMMCSSIITFGNVTITAKLSRTTILMGDVDTLNVTVSQDKKLPLGTFPIELSDTLTHGVELTLPPVKDTTIVEGDKVRIMRSYLVQSFDSGLYVLPPIQYIVGEQTVSAPSLTLKVVPIRVDSKGGIHDYKPLIDVPFSLLDFVPEVFTRYWWLWLGGTAIGVILYLLLRGKKKKPVIADVDEVPKSTPLDEALERLTHLRDGGDLQKANPKQYFTTLTQIVRHYIKRQYCFNAEELTTSQLMHRLHGTVNKSNLDELKEMFTEADIVKFSKGEPDLQQRKRSLDQAFNFVRDTASAIESNENQKLNKT